MKRPTKLKTSMSTSVRGVREAGAKRIARKYLDSHFSTAVKKSLSKREKRSLKSSNKNIGWSKIPGELNGANQDSSESL